MGIAVPSQFWKAEHQQIMALIGYSGLGLAGYSWAGLGGWAAPLTIHRDGPYLCGNGENWINGLCKKKRSADSEADAYYGYGGYGRYGLGYGGYGYGGLGYGYGKRSADADAFYSYGGYGLGLYGKSAPCVNAANIPVPCTYGKRSAESDAYYGYGGAYTGYGYGGYGYGGLGYGYGK